MPAVTRTPDTRQRILDTAQRIMAGKGYSAVGINEVLAEAAVPKGSFYHYFASKDAFGAALLKSYFAGYLADMDEVLERPGQPAADRLAAYWQLWRETQSFDECQGRCLAVKLGAEVADMSEPMRLAMKEGTDAIADRLGRVIAAGRQDGSLPAGGDPGELGRALYDLWLGASVMAKIQRSLAPLDTAVRISDTLLRR
jgi:TetR/AcrR family transcriptional repressor of nem operon